MTARSLRIWIDLANTPHVLFFEPVVRALRARGHQVTLTARRFANTEAVLRARGVAARRLGAGHDASASEWRKRARHLARTARLLAFARRHRFDVAVSHASVTQAHAARLLDIPIFGTIDYEHRALQAFRTARRFMIPAVLPAPAVIACGIPAAALATYDGLKEHVYLAGFRPRLDVRARLGIGADEILICLRPIADHAAYNRGRDGRLQEEAVRVLASMRGARIVVLPRTARQWHVFAALARTLPALRLLTAPIDGPSLIAAADLVVSGGGTMLREAAVLGVPAVSIFAGPLGAVDRWLADHDRVLLIRHADDLRRLRVTRRATAAAPAAVDDRALQQIVQGICDTAVAR